MPAFTTPGKKRTVLIGSGVTLLLIVIMLGSIQLHPWFSSHAASDTASDAHDQFCRAYYHVTNGATSQGPADKYTSCQDFDTQFADYIKSLNFTYGSSTATTATKNWPATSLVVLKIPADKGKDINTLPAADIKQVETALTTYLKAHVSTSSAQQALDQAALNNWDNDPLLELALVTYSVSATTGKATFGDGDSSAPSIAPIITFLQQDSTEVKKIQTDLKSDLKSTTYTTDNADCSFTDSSLTTAYQKCLGTDTVIDRLYAEKASTGTPPATTYDNVITTIQDFITNEVHAYIQANSSSVIGLAAQEVYNVITSSTTDKKIEDTDIDHILTAIVTNQQQTSPAPKNLPLTLFSTLPTVQDAWYSMSEDASSQSSQYQFNQGLGTYADPVIFAIADNSKTFKKGMIIYIPELEKYFIAEDTCSSCADEVTQNKADHIVLWAGNLSTSCVDNLQIPTTIYSQSSDPNPVHYLIVAANSTVDQSYTVNAAPFTCGNTGS